MQAVLCMTCERPRLATAAVQDNPTQLPMSPSTGELMRCPGAQTKAEKSKNTLTNLVVLLNCQLI